MENARVAIAGLAIIAAQLSINVGAAIGKSLFPMVGPEGVAALRTAISALILLSIVRPWRYPLPRPQLIAVLFYGLVLGSMNLLIYWAFQRLPIGLAVAIEITGPLAIVLLTSRSAGDFLWAALAIGGLVLLIPWPGATDALDLFGVVCALGAAICWALYIVLGKRASAMGAANAVALGMAIACLITVPAGVMAAGTNLLHISVLSLGLVVTLLSSTVPYLLEMTALARLSSRIFGVMTSAAPALAALAGYVILDERLTHTQWIAVILMIGASAGCSLTARPQRSERAI